MKMKFIAILLSLYLYQNVSGQETLKIQMDKKNDNYAVFTTKIKSNLTAISKVMEDTAAYTQWLYACNKVQLLETVSPSEWILFFQFDVDYFVRINLFFLNDPFIIARTTSIYDAENQLVSYRLASTEKAYNIQDRSTLIENFNINWRFKQESDSVAVRYEIKIEDKAPFFLRFMITDYIQDSGYQTLQKLRHLVE
jgi:hypothetical protein